MNRAAVARRTAAGVEEAGPGSPPVEPVVAPPPGHPRFPLFDSLRAIAALAVLLSHVGLFTRTSFEGWGGSVVANGITGVTIFFAISGFLLYRPFVASDLVGAPRPRLMDFARRRVLRIFPAYWLALTVLAIYPGLSYVFTGDWWQYYGLVQVYTGGELGGLVQSWTLCVEVSFYALLPAYALLMSRLAARRSPMRRMRLEFVGLAVLAAASIALRAYLLKEGPSWVLSTLPATFYWFAVGMALAVVSSVVQARRDEPVPVGFVSRHPLACWAFALGLYAILSFVLRGTITYTPSEWMLQYVATGAIAFFLLLPAVFGGDRGGLPRRMLALPWLAWLGLVSYGIYLWQGSVAEELFKQGVGGWFGPSRFVSLAIATIILTVACAAVSYYVVERPVLRFKNGWPRRRPGRRHASAPSQ